MKKRELVLGMILVMATSFAIGCGSKSIANKKDSSTYNTIQNVTPETKHPTVIMTEKKTPEPMQTEAPTATTEPTRVEKDAAIVTPAAEKVEVKKTAAPNVVKKPQTQNETKPVKNMKGMIPVMTTIASYMAEGKTYDQENEGCYYSIMSMMANYVGYECGKSQFREDDENVYVGENAMQSLSAAGFSDHAIIGKVPNEYAKIVHYNKAKKEYVFSGSDAGDVDGKIVRTKYNGNGTYTVVFNLDTWEGDVLGSYEFTMVENQSKYSKVAPNLYYRVKSVKKLTE